MIRGGTVVDGTGAGERRADVAIVGDRIVAVGDVDLTGRREIAADGALVTPGWVDVHTHYDGQATWDQRLAPSSVHGVTTVVMGNCGVGFAPVHDSDHQRLIELMEGVEDIPGAALHEGLPWGWNSFGEYLDALDAIPHDIDLAAQLPHGALRLFVMGDRGAAGESATPDEIEQMGLLAGEAIRAGALGFTTSRTLNHRTSRGDPTPTLKASRDELVGIAIGVGREGTGVLQLVSDFIDVEDEFATLRAMVAASGRPASFSLVQSPRDPGGYRRMLDLLDEAHADGLEIRGQVATRAVGLLLGLQGTLNPLMANPVYREIADLPLGERVEPRCEMRGSGHACSPLMPASATGPSSAVGWCVRSRTCSCSAIHPTMNLIRPRASPPRRARAGRDPPRLRLRRAARRRRPLVPVPPGAQLRRWAPRQRSGDAGSSADRSGAQRRWRACRHHLRRLVPHDTADALVP